MTNQSFMIKGMPAALVAVAAMYAATAVAVDPLPFKQNSGFYQGVNPAFPSTAAACKVGDVCPAAPGFGGLDFYGAIPLAGPLAAGALGPFNAYFQVEWGCGPPGVPSTPAVCANTGVATTPWATHLESAYNPAKASRSSLEVAGGPFPLPAPGGPALTTAWTDISRILHHNQVVNVDSNVLDQVDVSSWFQLGTAGVLVDGLAPTTVTALFVETSNVAACNKQPAVGGVPIPGAPINPLGSTCDDFALLDGFDFTSSTIIAGALGPGEPSETVDIEFRPFAAIGDLDALVCLGSNLTAGDPEDPRCGTGGNRYNGPVILVYTAEGSGNSLSIQARLVPRPIGNIPQFVIGDCEYAQWKPRSRPDPADPNNLREFGDEVNFWGAQWWKNNCMSDFTSNGYPAFKGFATNVLLAPVIGPGIVDCGSWQARPGNSGHPPATLPDVIDIIVTDNVVKAGANISGNIKQIVRVDRTQSTKDNYAGNPGHQGWGKIVDYVCGSLPAPGAP